MVGAAVVGAVGVVAPVGPDDEIALGTGSDVSAFGIGPKPSVVEPPPQPINAIAMPPVEIKVRTFMQFCRNDLPPTLLSCREFTRT